jgi:SprT-like family
MTLPLTPDVLRAAYGYLAETDPFHRWNLPDPEDVIFRVTRNRSLCGYHDEGKRKPIIAVSSVFVKTTTALMTTMAHEMCHVHQFKHFRSESEHGPGWEKLADEARRRHGFDRGLF